MKNFSSIIAATFFLLPLHGNAQSSSATDSSKASAPPRSFVIVDKNKDGHISRDEAKQAGISNLNFDAADKDKDGKLNLSEWTLLKF
jgi:Ca2+-binding EF-hand superfamily protein